MGWSVNMGWHLFLPLLYWTMGWHNLPSEKRLTIIWRLLIALLPTPSQKKNNLEKLLEEYLNGCDGYHVVYITHENEYPESPLQQNILKTQKTVAVGLIGLAAKFQIFTQIQKCSVPPLFSPEDT